MRKISIILMLSVVTVAGYSQSLELDIQNKKLTYFINLENSYGSERLEKKPEYISNKGVAQAVLFRRKESKLPDLVSYYFYFPADSTIVDILYEWDDKNFSGYQENTMKSESEISGFIDKHNELYNMISQAYGKSKSKGDLSDLSKIATGEFQKLNVWYPSDNISIDLYIILSSKYEKLGPVSINPVYRIRLEIRTLK